MREIKFRGKNTKGEWVYGSLVVTTCGLRHKQAQQTKTWIVESAFGNGGWFNVTRRQYVKPETVGQFTGMIDKNGKEIYEGDMVSGNDGYNAIEVKFKISNNKATTGHGTSGKLFTSGWTILTLADTIEVVGNIFDKIKLIENGACQQ